MQSVTVQFKAERDNSMQSVTVQFVLNISTIWRTSGLRAARTATT